MTFRICIQSRRNDAYLRKDLKKFRIWKPTAQKNENRSLTFIETLHMTAMLFAYALSTGLSETLFSKIQDGLQEKKNETAL